MLVKVCRYPNLHYIRLYTSVLLGSNVATSMEKMPDSRCQRQSAESYCDCPKAGREIDCSCGEEGTQEFEWYWDRESQSKSTTISRDGRDVRFHMDYSCGTAAARGSMAMVDRQYFWEIKMMTPVYGTDMMVGVGTEDQHFDAFQQIFCSMIGRDAKSWGYSYLGRIQNKGEMNYYGSKFGQGSIIGVYLDMWRGHLYFYKNRQPLGLAASGLHGKVLYPIVSSTAARSGMRIIRACSFRTSLQFLCCSVLRSMVPKQMHVADALKLPPGLRAFLHNNLSWLLRPCELREPAALRDARKRRHSETDPAHFSAALHCARPGSSEPSRKLARAQHSADHHQVKSTDHRLSSVIRRHFKKKRTVIAGSRTREARACAEAAALEAERERAETVTDTLRDLVDRCARDTESQPVTMVPPESPVRFYELCRQEALASVRSLDEQLAAAEHSDARRAELRAQLLHAEERLARARVALARCITRRPAGETPD